MDAPHRSSDAVAQLSADLRPPSGQGPLEAVELGGRIGAGDGRPARPPNHRVVAAAGDAATRATTVITCLVCAQPIRCLWLARTDHSSSADRRRYSSGRVVMPTGLDAVRLGPRHCPRSASARASCTSSAVELDLVILFVAPVRTWSSAVTLSAWVARRPRFRRCPSRRPGP